MKKVVSLDELAALCRDARAAGKRLVLCHGVFDLLHIGHIRHLDRARQMGDILVVTVTTDRHVNKGPGRPAFGEILRTEALAALAAVDYVAVSPWPTAVEVIKLVRPAFYVKGSEYLEQDQDVTRMIVPERQAVEALGGQMVFTDEVTFSSSALLNRYFPTCPPEAISFLQALRTRCSAQDVVTAIQSLCRLRALVVGETIVDNYCYCQPEGGSPKRHLVVHRALNEVSWIGGAPLTAWHMAGFVGEVTLATACTPGESRVPPSPNIKPVLFDAPTIIKRRFIDADARRAAFAIEDHDEKRQGLCDQALADFLAAQVSDFDVVVVNDFGHGLIGPQSVAALQQARFLCVNAQTNSMNMGFNLVAQKYPRADFVCQDELEARLTAHDRNGDLGSIGHGLAARMGARMVAITQGRRGSTIFHETETTSIPPLATTVVDTMGTGDAYLALAGPCAAAGVPAEIVGLAGGAMGTLHAQTVGNEHPVEPAALLKFLTALLK